MTTTDHPTTSEYENEIAARDRAIGYHTPLDDMTVQWLASEVRMLHAQVEHAEHGRRQAIEKAAAREQNLRHVIAHELRERMWSWKLGKHATAGADRALTAVFATDQCPEDCWGIPVKGGDAR